MWNNKPGQATEVTSNSEPVTTDTDLPHSVPVPDAQPKSDADCRLVVASVPWLHVSHVGTVLGFSRQDDLATVAPHPPLVSLS